MTTNGRCYAPIDLEARERKNFAESGRVKMAVSKRKDKKSMNELVTEMEANES